MEKLFYEDYKVGEVFVSPGRTITETDIVLFSAFTGDWHELHTNVEYAAAHEYGLQALVGAWVTGRQIEAGQAETQVHRQPLNPLLCFRPPAPCDTSPARGSQGLRRRPR